ncbi:hypothetical protein CRG98_011850 [Punica granatum]|uniref:NAD-dependent epimerase/dehydratase domain-containing protein n=1 Tax=Punica granatum TaxID=22663 RepID=A0A2I0KGK0_PUNGR|nr:hypothetical protein CRG98_011850 [Punica granatum]
MEDDSSMMSVTYCVTGASGFIGSWLVKSLLHGGHKVHATVRDPAKSLHLQSLGKSHGDRLRIFQADLLEEGSFDEAVEGCDGVFHVAALMHFNVPEDGEDSVESNILEPAVRGTLNLLRGCLRSKKSVRRVVFTSSISTVTAKDSEGKWRALVDENCQTPIQHVWENKASGWVYVLSKILSEEAAFKFARANGINMVSVIAPTVAGDIEYFKILSAVKSRMGSIALAHTEDICRSHIFLMEQPNAHGRYLCCAQSCTLSELVEILAKVYPLTRLGVEKEENGSVPCEISSNKLKDLGFKYKFGADDIVNETVSSCLDCGFLPPLQRNDDWKLCLRE